MKNFFSFYNPRIGEGDSKIQVSLLFIIATIHKTRLKRGNAWKKKNKINVTINETIEARPGYVNLSVIRSRRLTLFESSQRNVCIYIYVP